jgi:hypothetical protein
MPPIEGPAFSWTGADPAEWMRTWQAVWRGAPEVFTQPILPGWTFNINGNNSTSPETEVEVLAKHSYGRQLGRISDALEVLIEERHGKTPKDKRFTDFLSMKHEIDKVKKLPPLHASSGSSKTSISSKQRTRVSSNACATLCCER